MTIHEVLQVLSWLYLTTVCYLVIKNWSNIKLYWMLRKYSVDTSKEGKVTLRKKH